jgi:hypothetical protein
MCICMYICQIWSSTPKKSLRLGRLKLTKKEARVGDYVGGGGGLRSTGHIINMGWKIQNVSRKTCTERTIFCV